MDTITSLANCANFGPWHAIAIVGCAFAFAWVLVTLIRN